MKFIHKIVAASAAIITASLLFVGGFQYLQFNRYIDETLATNMHELGEQVANLVDSELQGKLAVANLGTELATLDTSPEALKTLFASKTFKEEFVTSGYGAESDGAIIHNDYGWTPPADWDSRTRPWYKDAKAAGSNVITDPYVDQGTGAVLISMSQPVVKDGQTVGVTFFDVSLKQLSELINNVEINGGFLFAVDKDGNIISHPDGKLNGKHMSGFLGGYNKTSAKAEVIQVNGKKYFLNFSPTKTSDWFVGALIDHDVALAALREQETKALILIPVCLVLTIIGMLFIIRYLMRPLNELRDAMANVASGEGDLTKRLDTNSDQEFAEVARYFNQFTEMLQNIISETKRLSDEVLSVTHAEAKASQDSSERLNMQVQEIEQLATAMNEMSTTAQDVAGNAQNAAHSTQDADNAVEEGVGIVASTTSSISTLSDQIDNAVRVVKELEDASDNIESILSVITGIADQTNLLALNAAIEAARAGESGRGFAVVADEVRTLAQRTQESTTEIRQMIEQLQAGTQSATSVMQQSKELANETVASATSANESLMRIREAISLISDMNLQIASAAEEQSLVAEEISGNTVNIKDLSDLVAEQANSSAEQMTQQVSRVEEQESLLGRFIV